MNQDSQFEVCPPGQQMSMWQEEFQDLNYIQKSMKETYVAMSQLLNETPNSLLLRNLQFEVQGQKLLLERCNIDEKCIKSVVCMLINFKEQIHGLSFHNNTHFKDFCLKQFLEYLNDTTTLKTLSLEKVSVSDSALMKFFEVLPSIKLDSLNLASNVINYFGFEHFAKVIKEDGLNIKTLNFSNTRLTDRGGLELFEAIVKNSRVEELDLSRNPGLGYKFAISAINIVKTVENHYNVNPMESENLDLLSKNDQLPSQLCARSFDSQDTTPPSKHQQSTQEQFNEDKPLAKAYPPVTINLQDLIRMESASFDTRKGHSISISNPKNHTPSHNESYHSQNLSQSPNSQFVKSRNPNRLKDHPTKSTAQSSRLKFGNKKIHVQSVDDQNSEIFNTKGHYMSYDNTPPYTNLPQDQKRATTLKNSMDERMIHNGDSMLRCEELYNNHQPIYEVTNTAQLINNLKVLSTKPIPKHMPPAQGPYKLLAVQPERQKNNQNLYKRVRENSNRFIPYRQISPNKILSYQEYYRQQKMKQDKIIQKKITPNTSKCYKKHQMQQESSRGRRQRSQLAPKILSNQNSHKIGNAHFKNEKQIKIIDLITDQHMKKVDQLSSERYSQKNAYKNYIQSRKISTTQNSNRRSMEQLKQHTPQRIYSQVPNSQSNTPSSSVTRMRGNTCRSQYIDHTPKQKSHRKSYSTTKNNSSINTIRFRPQFSNEKGFMSENKNGELQCSSSSIGVSQNVNDVGHIKDMIKSEIERLQYLYQTIDNVIVNHQTQSVDQRSQISQSQIF